MNKLFEVMSQDVSEIANCDLPWEQLAGTRVLVTGAGGFLGGYIARTLNALYKLGRVSQPVEVVAMVRNIDRAKQRFSDLLGRPNFQLFAWDLNSIATPDFGKAHYIIHAASQASPRFYGTDPVGTLLPNTVGTAALLEALRKGGDPRGFLFVSSSEVYGAVTGDVALPETQYGIIDPVKVRACYAESKRMGEAMCVAWHHQHNLPTFIVRPFHTYGPGLTPEDGRVFSDFAFNVVRNENIVMNSDGTARRAFCYASDAVAGFFSVLFKGTPATPYNVANPAGELSVAELADLMVRLFPEKNLSVERCFQADSKKYVQSTYSRLIPDVNQLLALGWEAKISPAIGFKRMIESYIL